MTIVTICSEATLISASLSQIQNLVLRRHDLTNVLQARPDLAAALDTSLIGCAVLFSCLHEETQCITKGSMLPAKLTWKGKARAIWNHDRLRELLDGLRGQQTAINTIINLLQVYVLRKFCLSAYLIIAEIRSRKSKNCSSDITMSLQQQLSELDLFENRLLQWMFPIPSTVEVEENVVYIHPLYPLLVRQE